MERHGGRRLLLALSWVLAAAAGFLAAWTVRPEGGGGGGADGPGVPPRDAGAAPSTAPASAPSPTRPPGGGASVSIYDTLPAPPSDGPMPPPPAPASVLVTVVDADGTTPEEGTVYAVGAGEPGGDDSRVFGAPLEGGEDGSPGSVRLRLPSAGTYDIGFRSDRGATLLTDVAVAPGDGNRATVRLAAAPPVRVRIEGGWPPPGTEDPCLRVDLHAEDGGEQAEFPGRGRRGWAFAGAYLYDDEEDSTGPLDPGRTYRVEGTVREILPDYGGETAEARRALSDRDSPRFLAVPDRETVRPGEAVAFRVRPLAAVALLPAGSIPASEKGKVEHTQLRMRVLREGKVLDESAVQFQRDLAPGKVPGGVVLSIDPGPFSVAWSGYGILAGSREGLVAKEGEILEVEIPVLPDPEGEMAPDPEEPGGGEAMEEAPPEDLLVRVEGVPAGRAVDLVRGNTAAGQEDDVWILGEAAWEEPGLLLEGFDRPEAEFAAFVLPSLASDFLPAPATGDLALALRPAGLLVVVPAEILPEEYGHLRIRRPDGRPIPLPDADARGLDAASREPEVCPGYLLGPFPEGSITFEVRLGGLRLPDARATVRAGRIEVLRISR